MESTFEVSQRRWVEGTYSEDCSEPSLFSHQMLGVVCNPTTSADAFPHPTTNPFNLKRERGHVEEGARHASCMRVPCSNQEEPQVAEDSNRSQQLVDRAVAKLWRHVERDRHPLWRTVPTDVAQSFLPDKAHREVHG